MLGVKQTKFYCSSDSNVSMTGNILSKWGVSFLHKIELFVIPIVEEV